MTEQVTKEDEWAIGNYLDAAEAYVRPPSGSDARYLMEQAFARHRIAAEQRAFEEAWQPFDTAPTDGTPVLAYMPDPNDPEIDPKCAMGVHWYEPSESCWLCEATGGEPIFPATHWRPLPPPPANMRGSGEGE